MLTWLSGKKTYIVGAITFIAGGLKAIGVDVPAGVLEGLLALTAMFLRAGVEKTVE